MSECDCANVGEPCYLRDGPVALMTTDDERCLACNRTPVEVLTQQTVKTLEWMIVHMKWKANQNRQILEENAQGSYSPELITAINLLTRWKELEKL